MSNLLKKKSVAYIVAVICMLFWGTAFPMIKLGYNSLGITESDIGSKLLFAGERFVLAGVLAFLISLIFTRKSNLPVKQDFFPILLLGLVQTTLQYLFSYWGVGFTSATNTAVITGTISLISVIFAAMFFKDDRLTLWKVLGCIIGFGGIFFVNTTGWTFADKSVLGDFLVLMSTVCAAGSNVITKKIGSNRNPVTITSFQLFFGGLILIIIGVAMKGTTNYTSAKSVFILLWLSLVSAVAFLLWTALLKHNPVSRISVFNMLIPIFGTICSGVILKEDIFKWENLVSLVLISVGILMVNAKLSGEKNGN